MVTLTIDNKQVSVPAGTTILDAARAVDIHIPTLCYLREINEVASCRVCAVEVEGVDKLATACNTLVEEGMVRKYVLDGKSSACYQFLSDEPHLCQEHFHLKCTCCGRLFHVSCDYLNQLGEHLLEHHGFVIDHTKTVLYGLCADCAAKEQEKKM